MRRSLILAVAAFSTTVFAQTTISFECYPDGPLPFDPIGSCEQVVSNGLGGFGAGTGVTSATNCGFPTNGIKYVRVDCNGPMPGGVPPGGPPPFPVPTSPAPAEVRIPIPVGSTTVSFDWDYFNAEGVGSGFNDGMAVAVLNTFGNVVQQLVYADNQIATASCFDSFTFATEIAPAGPQTFFGALPLLAGCEYISVIAWNDGDNAVSGTAYIDNVVFNAGGPVCPPPCFGGAPTLTFSAPSGVSCIQVNMSGLAGNGLYFLAVTLNAGGYPNGWFYGVDIGLQELVTEVNAGFPFSGGTNSCGSAQIGEFCGLPSGLPLYAVALGIPGPTLGPWNSVSPAANFVIP